MRIIILPKITKLLTSLLLACLLITQIGIFKPFFIVIAQELGIGVAQRLTIIDPSVPDGSIISWSAGGYRLSTQPFDPAMYGVAVINPAISLEDSTLPQSVPVLTSGQTYVLVTTVNGPISEGDNITSSSKPGIGQRADRNGYVLGTALAGFSDSDPNTLGKVLVSINIRSTIGSTLRTNLLDLLKLGVLAPFEAPLNALRYLLATIFMALSFILGFIYFGRVVAKGVEAMGRNPLASNIIGLSIFINLILTIVIMLFGIGLAYLVLRL